METHGTQSAMSRISLPQVVDEIINKELMLDLSDVGQDVEEEEEEEVTANAVSPGEIPADGEGSVADSGSMTSQKSAEVRNEILRQNRSAKR